MRDRGKEREKYDNKLLLAHKPTQRSTKAKEGMEMFKSGSWEGFGEQVGEIVRAGNAVDLNSRNIRMPHVMNAAELPWSSVTNSRTSTPLFPPLCHLLSTLKPPWPTYLLRMRRRYPSSMRHLLCPSPHL